MLLTCGPDAICAVLVSKRKAYITVQVCLLLLTCFDRHCFGCASRMLVGFLDEDYLQSKFKYNYTRQTNTATVCTVLVLVLVACLLRC